MYVIHFDHEIPYRNVYDNLLPILNMTFRVGSHQFDYPMLVDTGSDHVALPAWSAELLGIELSEDCTHTSAVSLGGYSDLYQYSGTVMLEIPDLDDAFRMPCDIVFSPGLNERSFGILGRRCTLHHLAFGFHESRNHHAFYVSLSPQVQAW